MNERIKQYREDHPNVDKILTVGVVGFGVLGLAVLNSKRRNLNVITEGIKAENARNKYYFAQYKKNLEAEKAFWDNARVADNARLS